MQFFVEILKDKVYNRIFLRRMVLIASIMMLSNVSWVIALSIISVVPLIDSEFAIMEYNKTKMWKARGITGILQGHDTHLHRALTSEHRKKK